MGLTVRGISIILNGETIHTGNDLDLVQEKKEIGKPEIQSHTVEVPGRNGLLNLTKSLTGKVAYTNRKLEFQYFGDGSRAELLLLDDLFSEYHGETVRIIDDDRPNHYYEGEMSVSTEIHGNYITIELEVDAQPFRMKRDKTIYQESIVGNKTITIRNEGVETIPTITVDNISGDMTIEFNGLSTRLSSGSYTREVFTLQRGTNTFQLYGDGNITVEYQEGAI